MSSIYNIISKNNSLAYQQNAKLPSGSLKSIDFITLVDILSEGEIELSATAHKDNITDKTSAAYKNAFLKDLFLNNQPVLASDANVNSPATSDFNYDSVDFQFQQGTANNAILPAAEIQSIELQKLQHGDIGELVRFQAGGSVITRSVTLNNVNVDKVRVRVKFDQFFRIDTSSGDRKSTSVNVQIKINPNNGSEQTVITDTVRGKSTSSYSRDYGIRLSDVTGYNTTAIGQSGAFFPITVTLTRTNDEGDANTLNFMRLSGVTEIIEESNNYPHVAYTSLRFSAEEFPSLPSRVLRVRGKKIKIPHNATVERATGRLTYSGTFNGSFKKDNNNNIVKEWTSDPAWILYDLLISHEDRITRNNNNEIEENLQYGCGLPESSLDKFVFQKASEYCGELVDDGQGGQEPRFSLNVNIRTQQEALKVINDICSVMRAMPFYSEGTIKISQDAPKDFANPSTVSFDYVFNNANVVDGNFVYSGSSLKTRFTIINISYFDLGTQQLDYVTVKDTAAIAKYGEHINTIRTFGTTSRGQAQRVGKWFLNTQQTATETCVFETNIAAGSVVQIGSIIGIADRVKAATRRGGVVKAVSSSQGNSNIDQITIDNVDGTNQPDISDSPTISCLLSNGTVETKTISGYSADQTVVNVSSAFSSAPVVNSPYIFESASLLVTNWRVINIKETAKKTYAITALSHNQDKYAAVEDGEQLPSRTINLLTAILSPPSGLTLEEKIVVINNRAVPKVFIDWQAVEGASGYTLQYRRDGDNFTLVNTQETTFEIVQTEFEAGSYDIRLFTVNSLGQRSNTPTEANIAVNALSALPEQPTNLEIEPINNYQVRLSWDLALAKDVIFGGRCLIRHSTTSLATTTFSNSIDLDTSNGNTTEVVVPALAGTYSIKFEDLASNLSANEAKVEFALPETEDELVIKQQREQTAFSGTKTNLSVVSGALQLTNPANNLTGTYDFANTFDLGAVYQNLRLKRHIKSEGFNISDQFDSIPDLDARVNFDGAAVDRLKGRLTVQTSNDNSTYTSFINLRNGSFVARYFKFKSNLISVDTNENIKFLELGFDASLPSRVENKYISSGNVISTPIQSGTSASGVDIVFANRFFTGTSDIGGSNTTFLPVIGISPYNLDSGDYFVLSNVSGTGFTIVFKNSSDSPIDVKFSFQALGYGKGA
jgi:predicted phage tail protein